MLGMAPKESSAKNNKSLAEAVEIEKKYPYLWDNGNWSTSKNVRNVFVMGSGGIGSMITLQHNEFMTGALTPAPEMIPGFVSKQKKSIGPELGTYPYGCMGVLFRTYLHHGMLGLGLGLGFTTLTRPGVRALTATYSRHLSSVPSVAVCI